MGGLEKINERIAATRVQKIVCTNEDVVHILHEAKANTTTIKKKEMIKIGKEIDKLLIKIKSKKKNNGGRCK